MLSNDYTVEKCTPPSGTKAGIYVACCIAQKYSHRLPTAKELMEDWGMHRATAYRWLAALRAVRGLSANGLVTGCRRQSG